MADTVRTLTRREKVEEREKAILESARRIFLRQGFEKCRMSDIAKAAGMGEGTLYIYYKTKLDLMQALVDEFWIEYTADAKVAVGGNEETFEALSRLARFHVERIIERTEFIELTQAIGAQEGLAERRRENMRKFTSIFDAIYLSGVDRGDLRKIDDLWVARDIFFGSLDYAARTAMLRDRRDCPEIIENMEALFRSYFGPRRPSETRTPNHFEALINRLEGAVEKIEDAIK